MQRRGLSSWATNGGIGLDAALRFSRAIDALNYRFGIAANYLVLFAALLSAANAGFRYGINAFIQLSRDYHFLAGIQGLIDWYGANSNSSWKRNGTCSPAW